MLEDKETFGKSEFVEFGIKGCNSSYEHTKYVLEKGHRIVYLEKDIRRFKGEAGSYFNQIVAQWEDDVEIEQIFISFDVDSINSAWCPGVSAPSVVGGLKNMEALEIMRRAG